MDFLMVKTVYLREDNIWDDIELAAINKNHIIQVYKEAEGVLGLITSRYQERKDGTGKNIVTFIRHTSLSDFVQELNGQ